MNARRRLIALGAAVFLGPRMVAAQPPTKVYRVGFLAIISPKEIAADQFYALAGQVRPA